MRFMIIGKATKDTEAGVMPPPDAFAAMQQYHEELVKAGSCSAPKGSPPARKGRG